MATMRRHHARVRREAMREGAAEFLVKPFDDQVLLRRVRAHSICEQQTGVTGKRAAWVRSSSVNIPEAVVYAERSPAERPFERIIGNSAALETVLEQVECVAPTDSTVL